MTRGETRIQDPYNSIYYSYQAQVQINDAQAAGQECSDVNTLFLQAKLAPDQQPVLVMQDMHKIQVAEKIVQEENYGLNFQRFFIQNTEQQNDTEETDKSEQTESESDKISLDPQNMREEGQDDLECNELQEMNQKDKFKDEQEVLKEKQKEQKALEEQQQK